VEKEVDVRHLGFDYSLNGAHQLVGTCSIHLGRGRVINDPAPNFHVTVRARMQDKSLKYTPRAKWTKGAEVYVE
jgi:hypothetical protein